MKNTAVAVFITAVAVKNTAVAVMNTDELQSERDAAVAVIDTAVAASNTNDRKQREIIPQTTTNSASKARFGF